MTFRDIEKLLLSKGWYYSHTNESHYIYKNNEKENNNIPKASKIEEVSFEELEKNLDIDNWDYTSKFKTYIAVDISKYAEIWGKELVKKTVNIPKWINSKAESLKINFSKTLEEALLKKIYNR